MKALWLALLPTLALAEQPLPVYPGTVHTRIGNDLLINGEYYRLAYFESGDSLKKIADYFRKQWGDEGYPVTVDGNFVDEGVVSAFYTREGLQRSVVLKLHDGKTLGFTVLKDLWVREPLARAAKLPKLEGALVSQEMVLREESGGTQARAGLYALPMSEVREQANKSFTGNGYALIRESQVKLEGRPQRVLEFARGKEQAVLTLSEVGPNLVAAQQTWVGSDRPDAVPNDEALKAARSEHERKKAERK